ncbi:hypothetical protein [Marinilabilia salmonicolor]|uniref:Tail length tape measure protein n=1 Tax=Marinilabilia salmonicolor TaxID=989 RepID=A0A368VEG9_9BACT|nr:hypothetical protein [Marinilabilia salmonicolor]RCW38660.1 hypothetical protein DFO77_103130 [Marinilabilia salmonicolor]
MADKEFNLIGVLKANTANFERGIDRSKQKVGQFNRNQKQASKMTKNIGKSLMSVAGSFGAVFGGAAIAVKGFQGIVTSSQAAGDKWTVAVDGMKGSLDAFYRSIGTGDFDNLIDNMIRGRDAAEEFSKAMDDLFEGSMSLKINTAEIDKQIAQLETDRKNAYAAKDYEKVLEIAEKINKKEEEKLALIQQEANLRYKAFQSKANSDLGFTDNQLVEFLKGYRTDSNIREEAQAFIDTEAELQDEVRKAFNFRGKEAGQDAQKELENFRKTATDQIKIYVELMRNYAGSTDEFIQNTVSAYTAGIEAETQSLKKRQSNEQQYARAKEKVDKERIASQEEYNQKLSRELALEQSRYTNTRLKGKGVSSVGSVGSINTTSLVGMQGVLANQQSNINSVADLDELENSLFELQGLSSDLAGGFMSIFDEGEKGFSRLGDAVENFANQVIQQLIGRGILMLLSSLIPGGSVVGGLLGFSEGGTVPKFATGGIVSGSSTIGDNMLARVNSGEMILNDKQQSSLFRMLDKGGNGGVSGDVRFEIAGDKLIGVLNNHQKRQNSYR